MKTKKSGNFVGGVIKFKNLIKNNTSDKSVYNGFIGEVVSKIKDTSDLKTLHKFINKNFNKSIWSKPENQVWVIVHCKNLTRSAKESFRLDVLEKLKIK